MSDSESTLGKEFFVGMFVTTGIALFIFFVFSIGGLVDTFRDTKNIEVEFEYLGGLKQDQPVLYAGYQVGTVKKVEIRENPPIMVTILSVPSDLPVYENSEVLISSSGLIGDKVVEILPPKKPGKPVKDGGTVVGQSPINMAQMLGEMRNLFDKGSEENLTDILKNAKFSTQKLAEISQSLHKVTTKNEDKLATIIKNVSNGTSRFEELMTRMDTTAISVRRFADELRGVSEENRAEFERLIQNLSKSSEHLPKLLKQAENTASSLDTLAANLSNISSEKNPELREMISNLRNASKNLEVFSDKIRNKPWRLLWDE